MKFKTTNYKETGAGKIIDSDLNNCAVAEALGIFKICLGPVAVY
jgi:hypothetical protein